LRLTGRLRRSVNRQPSISTITGGSASSACDGAGAAPARHARNSPPRWIVAKARLSAVNAAAIGNCSLRRNCCTSSIAAKGRAATLAMIAANFASSASTISQALANGPAPMPMTGQGSPRNQSASPTSLPASAKARQGRSLRGPKSSGAG